MNKHLSYHQLAQRTSAPTSPEMVERVRQKDILADMAYCLSAIAGVAKQLDAIKAYIFYNRPYTGCRPETKVTDAAAMQIRKDWEVKIIHGGIGMISEAGEIASLLFDWLYMGKELDVPNLIEEMGDSGWFREEAIAGLNAAGVTVDTAIVDDINITKLRKRFPHKFTELNANERNLDEERFAIAGPFAPSLEQKVANAAAEVDLGEKA